MMKKILSLLIVLGLFSASCTSSHSKKTSEKNQPRTYLRVNLPGDPPTLDPRKGGDIVSSAVHFLLFEGLTRITENSTSNPGIAESIDISEDRCRYVFHLRDSKWSNGADVTAHDFEYSWKTMLMPDFPCPNANLLYFIKNAEKAKSGNANYDDIGIEAIDEKTLVVTLESPTPFFLDLISFCVFYPAPSAIAKPFPHWADDATPLLISNGPYTISSWKHEDEIVLKKNPFYWDSNNVLQEEIRISLLTNPTTVVELFNKGEIDIMGGPYTSIPNDAINSFKEKKLLKLSPAGGTTFCVYNLKNPIFQNIKIRQALSVAIDRKSIVENITSFGELIAENFIPPVLKKGKNLSLTTRYNPEHSKNLLEEGLLESGYSKNDLEKLTLIYIKQEQYHKLAQAVQQLWKQNLGIDLKIQAVDYKQYLSEMSNKNFDLSIYYWFSQYNDQMNIFDRFKIKENPKNYCGWENEKYISLLDESFNYEGAQRQEILQQAENLILEELPLTTIYHMNSVRVEQNHLSGIYVSPIGSVHLHKTKIIK